MLEPRLLVEVETTNEGDDAFLKSVVNWDCKGGYRKILKNKNKSDIVDKATSRTRSKTTLLWSFIQLCFENFVSENVFPKWENFKDFEDAS